MSIIQQDTVMNLFLPLHLPVPKTEREHINVPYAEISIPTTEKMFLWILPNIRNLRMSIQTIWIRHG